MNGHDHKAPIAQESERRALALLVVRCQLGEREALDQLVVDWHPSVYRYVTGFVQDARETDEVCQNVWLGVLRGLPGLKERSSFAPWLFGIARRSAFDWMRQRYRRVPGETRSLDLVVAASSAGDELDDAFDQNFLDRNRLDRGLDSLAPLEREVVFLHYFQELSIEQIGESIGVPSGTVKSRLHRARRKLRARLKETNHD